MKARIQDITDGLELDSGRETTEVVEIIGVAGLDKLEITAYLDERVMITGPVLCNMHQYGKLQRFLQDKGWIPRGYQR